MIKQKFPIFWTIIFLFGIAALLDELGYLVINIPWIPVIIIVIAIGGIFNRFQ